MYPTIYTFFTNVPHYIYVFYQCTPHYIYVFANVHRYVYILSVYTAMCTFRQCIPPCVCICQFSFIFVSFRSFCQFSFVFDATKSEFGEFSEFFFTVKIFFAYCENLYVAEKNSPNSPNSPELTP